MDRLSAALTAARFAAFVDRGDIQPTGGWRNRLTAMISEADAVVSVASA